MVKREGLGGGEQRAMLDLTDALGASLDLHQVLSSAYELLLPLVGADYGALAVTRGARPDEYEWIVQNLPRSFLGSYTEMAPHDFVRNAVIARPNVVLRDAEMVDRRALERNMMYDRAREVGSPIEQVMAVMLHVDGGWQSGLSLYRERRRPFSERDRLRLQRLTPAIANAVRNCRTFAAVACRSDALEALLGERGDAVVLVQPPAREIDRTARAATLLDAWFTPGERRGGALPAQLIDELRGATAAYAKGDVVPRLWRKPGKDADLEVKMRSVPRPLGIGLWALELHEVPHAVPVLPPPRGKPLTTRQAEVAAYVVLGWDDRLIAEEIDCKTSTVKKHLQRIFDKYGVSDRRKLMRLAMRFSC
jgi:DNA-binding CsgD family transcriptional regulator